MDKVSFQLSFQQAGIYLEPPSGISGMVMVHLDGFPSGICNLMLFQRIDQVRYFGLFRFSAMRKISGTSGCHAERRPVDIDQLILSKTIYQSQCETSELMSGKRSVKITPIFTPLHASAACPAVVKVATPLKHEDVRFSSYSSEELACSLVKEFQVCILLLHIFFIIL